MRVAVAFGLLLLALGWPQLRMPRSTFDAIVVFDITQSMNVADYELDGHPVSRLAFAREAARRALRDLPCGSRVGWGAFAEYRTILLLAPIEVCSGYNDLVSALDRIDGRMRWANASEITKGVYWAMRAARDVGGDPAILFLTDGQEAPPVTGPGLPLFDDLRVGAVHGWLMGVGGLVPRRIPKTDEEDRPIGFWHADEVVQVDEVSDSGPGGTGPPSHEELSALHEPHLRTLARRTGLDYRRLARLEDVAEAMRDPRLARRQPAPVQMAWIPATAALLLLASAFVPRGPVTACGSACLRPAHRPDTSRFSSVSDRRPAR
jgi:mxaL protein